ETFNLFIPRFMGGGSIEHLGKNSETYKLTNSEESLTYWGDQPGVEGPAYLGAVIVFLFVLALFLVKGRLKWWLVGGSVWSLLLSYGHNFGLLTDFFIDYVPLYSKFRAVTSIQVILELCVPILAVFGLVKLFDSLVKKDEKLKALKYSTVIAGGLAIIFLLFKSTFDFVGLKDSEYLQAYGPELMRAVKEDRKSIFTSDTIRTLILVLLSAGTIYLFLKQKLKQQWVIIVFGILILFDLIGVDTRYVNNEDFVPAIQVNKPYQANEVDKAILTDTTYFRVFDITSSGAKASYFHNSLNGYHAAKLQRYQDVFDFYISQNNINVMNMFNTKYIIAQDEEGNLFPYANPDANGNAWFIENFKVVTSANEEIMALDSLDNKSIAVLNKNDFKVEIRSYQIDSTASIDLIAHKPNYLKYKSVNKNDGF